MFKTIIEDIKAVKRNDPAAKNLLETLLCHTPLHTIIGHRIIHFLHASLHIPILPRWLAMWSRFWSGVEIHPGAKIGKGFFIDHGTGVVIGETGEIGDNCVLFHGVTLGGTGHFKDKRHPTLENNVLIGANATVLGPVKVGDNVRIGAATVIINRDVPPNCTVVGAPGMIVKRNGIHTREPLPMAHYKHAENGDPLTDDSNGSSNKLVADEYVNKQTA
ncbi:serine acetyltransferase [candidate division KSB1 bacterium]|nr:serine acetyltransferase [candidate division KSB1 bacterium]